VYGLDAELLAMVPQPCSAVLLLFPISAGYEKRRRAADEEWAARSDDEGLLWFKQNIGNACGTIALLHALANSPARSAIAADSPLAQLFASAAALSDPAERAALLQSSGALASAHADVAVQGQTAAPQATDDVDTHFVAFVRAPNGELVELDGRRRGPMYRGKRIERQEDLLSVAGQWIQEHFVSEAQDHCAALLTSHTPPSDRPGQGLAELQHHRAGQGRRR